MCRTSPWLLHHLLLAVASSQTHMWALMVISVLFPCNSVSLVLCAVDNCLHWQVLVLSGPSTLLGF